MKSYRRFASVALVLVFLALAAFFSIRSQPADASTVIGNQYVEVFAGDTAYTTTTYSSAYLVTSFGEVVLQIHDDISGTTAITVTPQFSNEYVACSSVSQWVDASYSGQYGTTTLSYGTVDVRKVVTGDDAEMLRFPADGRCLRLKITTGTTFTPTVYLRMVNTQ